VDVLANPLPASYSNATVTIAELVYTARGHRLSFSRGWFQARNRV
jgi:hypothetical protein